VAITMKYFVRKTTYYQKLVAVLTCEVYILPYTTLAYLSVSLYYLTDQ